MTGIHAPHLSELERGLRIATPAQLDTLSRLYGVRVEDWRLMLVQA